MPKNIVICCDGTGNQIEANLSNVLKLYQALETDDKQIVFYDPGIGTIGLSNLWMRLQQTVRHFFGMAVGYGLDDNILASYHFLIDAYEEGDQVFLFGFSRGAYTARALAGFLNLIGLLRPEQKNLSACALTAYKQVDIDKNFDGASCFYDVTKARKIPIHFMGVWDTVSSVLVPRFDRLRILSRQKLPFTAKNPHVKVFRHAASIDERRCMFRLNRWTEPQDYQENPFDKNSNVPQDVKQVWFAGVHADIGGGYPETESALAKFPLQWMIKEAQKFGLRIHASKLSQILGNPPQRGKYEYVLADPVGLIHNSMGWGWKVLEIIPKIVNAKYSEWPHFIKLGGRYLYLPWAERRHIPEEARIHHSVLTRKEKLKYWPPNMPKSYVVEEDA